MEGDVLMMFMVATSAVFLSTPSGWRATHRCKVAQVIVVFLSTPSGWRATHRCKVAQVIVVFLSTPSGWRATSPQRWRLWRCDISIHALRVEGDAGTVVWAQVWDDFYPRPPGGGRPCSAAITRRGGHFYPRPPGGGRHNRRRERHCPRNFYPRPPGGGRLLLIF